MIGRLGLSSGSWNPTLLFVLVLEIDMAGSPLSTLELFAIHGSLLAFQRAFVQNDVSLDRSAAFCPSGSL